FLFEEGKIWVLDYGAVLPVSEGIGDLNSMYLALRADDKPRVKELLEAANYKPKRLEDFDEFYGRMRDLYWRPFLQESFTFTHEFVNQVFVAQRVDDQKLGMTIPKGPSIANLRFYWSFYGLL